MINTFSQFWLLDPVTDNNFYIPFEEASVEKTAEVGLGEYTLSTITDAIESALNDAGDNTYTVSFDRSTRKYTISADANFKLLITSGSTVGNDLFSLIGFSGSDTSSDTSHTSNNMAGTVYEPQFKLQEYVPTNIYREASSASVTTTASGAVKVVSFGEVRFIEMNIMFITDINQGDGPIRSNASGVSDLLDFMDFARRKRPIEFLPDEDDVNTFETIILESTRQNRDGVGFKLKEMWDKGLPDYYETGKLVFRKTD